MKTENGNVDVDAFTMKHYSAIMVYKTAHYTFYLPVALAMRMVQQVK